MPTLVASPTSPKAHAEISAVPDSSNPTAPTPVTLNAISQAEWDAVPSKQRPVQFKAHIDQV
ncbi:MAG TPA: hypothetical protein VFV43_13020, partial [Limnobacter sp.]|nr:hypothetical protein [Limnobacter sp.]